METGRTSSGEARATWAEFVEAVGVLLEETDSEVPA